MAIAPDKNTDAEESQGSSSSSSSSSSFSSFSSQPSASSKDNTSTMNDNYNRAEQILNTIYERYSKSYNDINPNEKILKQNDFSNLLSCDELQHNDLIYLSKIASYIPFDIFNLLFIVSDTNDKGYIEKQDFKKFSQQLILPHCNTNNPNKQHSDLDIDINKILYLVFKIYENKSNSSNSSYYFFRKNNTQVYDLESPIKENTFINLVEKYNSADLPFVTTLLNSYKEENNTKSLNFNQFSNIMNELPQLKFDQTYNNLKNSNENITPTQLKSIAQQVFYDKLPPLVADHLETFASNKFGNEINYNDAFKLIKMIRDLPKLNYLTFEKISNDKNNPKFYLTSNSLFNYINSTNSNSTEITKDEILLYFNWNRFTNEYLTKNHSTIDPTELLAILTDDMVVPNEINKSYSKDDKSNFFHIFTSLHSFILGSFAGMIGASIVYPIDIIKTRMQNQKGNTLYSSYLDCFRKIIRNEGVLGLYSGLLPQVVGVAPEKAIKLTLNDLIRGIGKKQSASGDITLPWEILAGTSAGLCQVIVTNPLEVSKIRLQTQGEYIKQMKDQGKIVNPKTAVEVVRELGLRGLYKGASACLLRDIPFSGIYFPTYANIKKRVFGLDPGKPGKRSNLEAWELLASGAMAGMPAALLTTPCDVIKTRIQSKSKTGVKPYVGIIPTFKRILAEEGPRALFKGGVARICRSSPQFGFTLAAYELFKKTLPLDLFYDSQPPSTASKSVTPSSEPFSLSENSKRFKLSSSASAADLNPTLLALTNYYKSIDPDSTTSKNEKRN